MASFRRHRCEEFDDGTSLLSADFRIDCKSSRYNSMVVVSAVMLVIFPVGVPLALGWTLWRKRRFLYPRNSGLAMVVTHSGDGARPSVLSLWLRKLTPELRDELHEEVRSTTGKCFQIKNTMIHRPACFLCVCAVVLLPHTPWTLCPGASPGQKDCVCRSQCQ